FSNAPAFAPGPTPALSGTRRSEMHTESDRSSRLRILVALASVALGACVNPFAVDRTPVIDEGVGGERGTGGKRATGTGGTGTGGTVVVTGTGGSATGTGGSQGG